MKIGSHVSMSGDKMLVGAVEEAASYGASAMMVYTGAPQNTKRKPMDAFRIEEGHALMKKHGIEEVVVHAPYIINLGNTVNAATFELGVSFLQEEIKRAEALGAKQLVLHPGAHVKAGAAQGIAQIIRGLNAVITPEQTIKIALETMAGKGSECGHSFEELAQIIDGVTHAEKLSVCLDTCHIHDAGYAIADDLDGVLATFHRIIGLERLQVLHINDSKNPLGAKKDRHENIGFGHIGFDALAKLVHHPQLLHVPKILETPFVGEDKKTQQAPYAKEIDMLRRRQFDPQMKEMLQQKPLHD